MRHNYPFGFLVLAFLADFFNGSMAMNNSSIANTSSNQITPTMSSSFSQSLTSSMMTSINQSSNIISPTPTSTVPQSTSSITGGGHNNDRDSSDESDISKRPLPPETQRRDFELVANTKMKWVPYLLDRNSREFIFMAKLIEDKFNELLSTVAGFVKTKLSEFQQNKVTFILIIYTKKEAEITKAQLEKPIGSYINTGNDVLRIYQHEIKARFQEMLPDPNTKPVYANSPSPTEKPNHFLNFMQGFGIAIGMVVVFTMVVVIKYKVSQTCKSKERSEKESLKEGFDNAGLE